MKVALWLHGVVRNLYTNKQDLSWSEDVDYRIGVEHYRRHLFDSPRLVDLIASSRLKPRSLRAGLPPW